MTSRRVIISTLDWVPTATDIKAHEELVKAIRANDKDGLIELLQEGRLLDTRGGEQLRVLSASVWNNRTEARIMSGKHKGKRVWVVMKWVVN